MDRLALGLEAIDAGRNPHAHRIRVIFDAEARACPDPKWSGTIRLHALRYQPGVAKALRSGSWSRVHCSKRAGCVFRITHGGLCRGASVIRFSVKDAEKISYRNRVRRPVLLPRRGLRRGLAVTGLRAALSAAGSRRWSRVTATLAGNGTVVGRAHGDDRGEFCC